MLGGHSKSCMYPSLRSEVGVDSAGASGRVTCLTLINDALVTQSLVTVRAANLLPNKRGKAGIPDLVAERRERCAPSDFGQCEFVPNLSISFSLFHLRALINLIQRFSDQCLPQSMITLFDVIYGITARVTSPTAIPQTGSADNSSMGSRQFYSQQRLVYPAYERHMIHGICDPGSGFNRDFDLWKDARWSIHRLESTEKRRPRSPDCRRPSSCRFVLRSLRPRRDCCDVDIAPAAKLMNHDDSYSDCGTHKPYRRATWISVRQEIKAVEGNIHVF